MTSTEKPSPNPDAEYVVFYQRDPVNKMGASKIPVAGISYDETISVFGDASFVKRWKAFFSSIDWEQRPRERKSLSALLAASMLPIRFTDRLGFEEAKHEVRQKSASGQKPKK